MATDLASLHRPTEFLDYGSSAVQDFVVAALPSGEVMTDIARACALYYAVRDTIRYEVYGVHLSRDGLKASSIIESGKGFCVHKAIVYAAALRSVGIPCRLVYGDVRNHLASDRLRTLVGGDIFRYHSFTSVYLEGRWVKATPVFNKLLCRLYGMSPLEFDGRSDSLYHPYDEQGRRHMEFIQMRGEFDDVPYETVVSGIRDAHPRLFASSCTTATGSLVGEAASPVTASRKSR